MQNTLSNTEPVIGKVLALLMLYRGWSQSRLSEISGVSQPAINRILNKANHDCAGHRSPHVSTIKKLCEAFAITEEQLLGREPLTPRNIGERPGFILNVADVPLLNIEHLDFSGNSNLHARSAETRWLGCPVMHSDRTFAFPVSSNEMGGLWPSYMPGDVVYIDPEVSPDVGSDVLAVAPDNQKIFRRLHFFDGCLFLGAINPRYLHKLLRMDDCSIIGTAIVTCRIRNRSTALGELLKLSANNGKDQS